VLIPGKVLGDRGFLHFSTGLSTGQAKIDGDQRTATANGDQLTATSKANNCPGIA
jgi:hypothetical protein